MPLQNIVVIRILCVINNYVKSKYLLIKASRVGLYNFRNGATIFLMSGQRKNGKINYKEKKRKKIKF